MNREYTHELGEETRSVSGAYTLEQEEVLEFSGRPLLIVLGYAVVDSSCCGVGGCRFALVPGFLIRSRDRRDAQGRPVSEVEPVADPELRERIGEWLKAERLVQQVQFW